MFPIAANRSDEENTTPYVDDVFSTTLYTGNGSTQTITNGIDLAGKGGLVWLKNRGGGYSFHHMLFDTNRGVNKWLTADNTFEQIQNSSTTLTSFNTTGFSLGSDSVDDGSNKNTIPYASWTFRKAAKFFDVVTYTGDGVAGRSIAHSLGVTPGMVIVKSLTNSGSSWRVWHNSFAVTDMMILNSTAAKDTGGATAWNSTAPSATEFTLGTFTQTNASGESFVAYLFAHDTSSTGIIQCGSYTGNGSATGPTVSLGWEPQYVMVKNASGTGNWQILDSMRGMPVGSADATLQANLSSAESIVEYLSPTATGFRLTSTSSEVNTSGSTYIYMAIRRPNKPPTSGTQVYNAIARTGTGAAATVTGVGFAPDMFLNQGQNSTRVISTIADKARGLAYLDPHTTLAETTDSGGVGYDLDSFGMGGIVLGAPSSTQMNYGASTPEINYFFKRAPSFFDVVCYTGIGAADVKSHNLGVVPELMIVKNRSNAYDWYVFATTANQQLVLNSSAASQGAINMLQSYSSTTFKWVDTSFVVNGGTMTYVAYLFATLAGVSKVGSYTGNGTSQNINCGFAAGARFVLIKATSTTGDWLVADTARGIVSGNDPRLSLNSTAAEVTGEDWLDPYAPGFTVNQTTASANASGVSYIFLAIA